MFDQQRQSTQHTVESGTAFRKPDPPPVDDRQAADHPGRAEHRRIQVAARRLHERHVNGLKAHAVVAPLAPLNVNA